MSEHVLKHQSLGVEVIGTKDESGQVARYRGIQYGAISKRWTRSRLYQHDTVAPILAQNYGPRCPQTETLNHTAHFGPYLPFTHGGQDDLNCLNLNVTAPLRPVTELLPVLVFIHGGAFIYGAASDPTYESSRLVKYSLDIGKPVIVVTLNYRLGPFGFLAPKDANDPESIEGNFGLHDQVVALQWINKHIAGFGGDPNRITIAGESAGGPHALLGYQEKLGEGSKYFDRVIMQSGTFGVMGFWDRSRVDEIWQNALDDLDLEDFEAQEGLEMMRGIPWQQLVHIPAFQTGGYAVYQDSTFVSALLFNSEGEFLDYSPQTISAIMHGDNADEGNIFREDALAPTTRESLVGAAKEVLGDKAAQRLMRLYQIDNDSLEGIGRKETGRRIHRFPEDARFYVLSDRLRTVWPSAATYHLTAKSPFKHSRFPTDSYHELDNLYLFGNFDQYLAEEAEGEQHLRLGREMRSAWIKFVYGEQPWDGAFDGLSSRFGREATVLVPQDAVRQWSEARKDRLKQLAEFGIGNIVRIATKVFP